jgi:sporulation protein YlmC with PRC-barrel domain
MSRHLTEQLPRQAVLVVDAEQVASLLDKKIALANHESNARRRPPREIETPTCPHRSLPHRHRATRQACCKGGLRGLEIRAWVGRECRLCMPRFRIAMLRPAFDRSDALTRDPSSLTQGKNMGTNYVTRDNFGMYANSSDGPGPALMGANTLLGNDVYNKDDENLGDIKEFMIDMASGKIAYAVLSFGGVLGMGDKLFAVPWAALTLDTVNKRFTLNVTKETLKDAPGFNKDRWPSMSDRTWASGVHTFYGTSYGAD